MKKRRIIIGEGKFRRLRKRLLREYRNFHEVIGVPSIFEYLKKYNVKWVLEQYFETKKERWAPLISPEMYKSALDDLANNDSEFTRFNVENVYSMLARIMKNTSILYANSLIMHSNARPEMIPLLTNFVRNVGDGLYKESYLKAEENEDKEESKVDIYIPVTENTIGKVFNHYSKSEYNYGYDVRTFRGYDEFAEMYNSYFHAMDDNQLRERVSFEDLVHAFGNMMRFGSFRLQEYNGKFIYLLNDFDYFLFNDTNFLSWAVSPDGIGNAYRSWSKMGCSQIIDTLSKYKPGVTKPEEVMQIIDRTLNIVHDRGDLAYLFIEGGLKSLNKISGISSDEHYERLYMRKKEFGDEKDRKNIKSITDMDYYG